MNNKENRLIRKFTKTPDSLQEKTQELADYKLKEEIEKTKVKIKNSIAETKHLLKNLDIKDKGINNMSAELMNDANVIITALSRCRNEEDYNNYNDEVEELLQRSEEIIILLKGFQKNDGKTKNFEQHLMNKEYENRVALMKEKAQKILETNEKGGTIYKNAKKLLEKLERREKRFIKGEENVSPIYLKEIKSGKLKDLFDKLNPSKYLDQSLSILEVDIDLLKNFLLMMNKKHKKYKKIKNTYNDALELQDKFWDVEYLLGTKNQVEPKRVYDLVKEQKKMTKRVDRLVKIKFTEEEMEKGIKKIEYKDKYNTLLDALSSAFFRKEEGKDDYLKYLGDQSKFLEDFYYLYVNADGINATKSEIVNLLKDYKEIMPPGFVVAFHDKIAERYVSL